MRGEITEHLCLVLRAFLEIDLGFCGSLGTASIYNKDKPWHHHYIVSSICVLSLFMNFEMIDCVFLISKWQGTASSWQSLGPAWLALGNSTYTQCIRI